ncbi:hypothetical protein FH5_02602 [Priestia endophytica]|nr:hypothetical protein FH5_02602 [Priestia endophytica]
MFAHRFRSFIDLFFIIRKEWQRNKRKRINMNGLQRKPKRGQ